MGVHPGEAPVSGAKPRTRWKKGWGSEAVTNYTRLDPITDQGCVFTAGGDSHLHLERYRLAEAVLPRCM